MKRNILSDQAHKNTRGNTRLNAADEENQQLHSLYETKNLQFRPKKGSQASRKSRMGSFGYIFEEEH